MKDRVCERTYLITTVFAFVYFLATDTVVFWFSDATFWTGDHTPKALLEDVVKAGVVIGKLLMEVVDSVARCLHTTSVADLLHDVKG